MSNRSLKKWIESADSLRFVHGSDIFDALCNGIRLNKQCIVSHVLLQREQARVGSLESRLQQSLELQAKAQQPQQGQETASDVRRRAADIDEKERSGGEKRSKRSGDKPGGATGIALQLKHERYQRERAEAHAADLEARLQAMSKEMDERTTSLRTLAQRHASEAEDAKKRLISLEKEFAGLSCKILDVLLFTTS